MCSGQSIPLAPLWLAVSRDRKGSYDSDDEHYLDAELDLQRRMSSGEGQRERLAGKYSW